MVGSKVTAIIAKNGVFVMSRSVWTQFATFKRIFYNEQVYNNFSTFDQNSYNFSSISPAKNDVLCNIWNVKEIVDGFNTSTSTNYSNELT